MNQSSTIADRAARILIVDDQPLNRQLIEVLLSREGFELLMASGGEEALAIVADAPPDIILLDVMMPGMSGYEVAARLKGNDATKHIAIIMISALHDHQSREHGLLAGIDDYFGRPVDRSELMARIRALLDRKGLGGGRSS